MSNEGDNNQKGLDVRTVAELLGATATFTAGCLTLALGVTSRVVFVDYLRLAIAAILGLGAFVTTILFIRYVTTQWKPSSQQKTWFRWIAILAAPVLILALGVFIQARFPLLPTRTPETPTPTVTPISSTPTVTPLSPTPTVTPLLPTPTPTVTPLLPTPTPPREQSLAEDLAMSLRSIVPDGSYFFTLYFDITNNSNKPFTISYKDTDIWVEDDLGGEYRHLFTEAELHSIEIGIGERRTTSVIFQGPVDSKVSLLDVTAMLMLDAGNEVKELHWKIPLQWVPGNLVKLTTRNKIVWVFDTNQPQDSYLILYFDITNDSDKPFIVRYKDNDIRIQDNQGTTYELVETKWMQMTIDLLPGERLSSGTLVKASLADLVGKNVKSLRVVIQDFSGAQEVGSVIELSKAAKDQVTTQSLGEAGITQPLPLTFADFDDIRDQAVSYGSQRNHEKALASWALAISLATNKKDAATCFQERGEYHFRMQEYDEAIEEFTKAVALDPEKTWSYVCMGEAYFHQKEYDACIDSYTRAIDLEPDNAGSRHWRGICYKEKGPPYEEALEDFTKAIDLEPQTRRFYELVAEVYAEEGKWSAVIEQYDTLISLSPEDSVYYYKRAKAYEAMGQNEKAIEDFQEAKRIDEGATWVTESAEERLKELRGE
jgi:tetratricopeptide (TPR) repeat protein